MLDDEGRAVLIDFDAALPLGEPMSHKLGTPGFMPPEADEAPASAKTMPQPGYDSSRSECDASSSSSSVPAQTAATGPASAAHHGRRSSIANDTYALAQLARCLERPFDAEAEKARLATQAAEEAAEMREWRIESWTELVRLGHWTQARMDGAMRAQGDT
jgi:serine/threonine protein kinase